ncbi:hypothetical protein [Chryseobacterium sp. MP_3.2]|uniref:hypothetical protein n=1 Tax=Chryseobacterium sp. MP_3.2 TaxID=3071712 RepID=UPI002E09CCE3|nr:hypothetical protein [Chryseobacterium sp. MP_3.2]
MKIILTFLLIILFTACSENQLKLDEYEKYPMKFIKKKVDYPNNDFEIYIPYRWNWKVENYESVDEIILGIDAVSKADEKNFVNVISIQKSYGFSNQKNIENEYSTLLKIQKNKPNLKLIEYGKTKIFKNVTYFIHSKSNTGKYGEIELITMITKSKSDNSFYYLTASASRTDKLTENMSIMVQCLRTFKEKEKEKLKK